MAVIRECNAKWPSETSFSRKFEEIRTHCKIIEEKTGKKKKKNARERDRKTGKTEVSGGDGGGGGVVVIPGGQSSSGEWARRTLLQVRFHRCYSSRWTEL